MLQFYNDAPNYQANPIVYNALKNYESEIRKILPKLPEPINIWLDTANVIPETGEGGFAYSSDTINISIDVDFKDKALQLHSLRGTVFHEAYHITQGHTFVEPSATYASALDGAIYEGCATIFEREYAGSSPLWGNYMQYSIDELAKWRDTMANIPYDDYQSESTGLWQAWAFYDPSDKQRWKLYKTGTWIVDEALRVSKKDIFDLRTLSAAEIRALLPR